MFSIREQPIDFACWLGSLAQSVERQHIKLRVVGSSPAGVHFFFLFLSIRQTDRQTDRQGETDRDTEAERDRDRGLVSSQFTCHAHQKVVLP